MLLAECLIDISERSSPLLAGNFLVNTGEIRACDCGLYSLY